MAETESETPAAEQLPDIGEAASWLGFKLDDEGGRSAGRVEGLFVDADSGLPTWLAIKTGRLRGHSAVPYELAAAGVGHVWVPYPKDAIRNSPEVDPAGELGPDLERQLCDHYGIPAGSRRRAALDERGESAGPTSVPYREPAGGS